MTQSTKYLQLLPTAECCVNTVAAIAASPLCWNEVNMLLQQPLLRLTILLLLLLPLLRLGTADLSQLLLCNFSLPSIKPPLAINSLSLAIKRQGLLQRLQLLVALLQVQPVHTAAAAGSSSRGRSIGINLQPVAR
jgi:hypothetical protein